jgi:hypothetical protein
MSRVRVVVRVRPPSKGQEQTSAIILSSAVASAPAGAPPSATGAGALGAASGGGDPGAPCAPGASSAQGEQLCQLSQSLRRMAPRVAVLQSRRAGGSRGDERSALLPPLHVSLDGMFEPSRPPRAEAEQSAVFAAVSDMVASAVYLGRSGCVLAYGSTGARAGRAPCAGGPRPCPAATAPPSPPARATHPSPPHHHQALERRTL